MCVCLRVSVTVCVCTSGSVRACLCVWVRLCAQPCLQTVTAHGTCTINQEGPFICCVRWPNETATAPADIRADFPDVHAKLLKDKADNSTMKIGSTYLPITPLIGFANVFLDRHSVKGLGVAAAYHVPPIRELSKI